MLFPGVCKCSLGESANVGARACFLRHYKGTTFAATVLTMAGDAVRLLDFISKKHHPSYFLHLPSSWFSQLLDDSPYLTRRERLAGGFVARRLQLLPEQGAAANPTHQVAHSRAWTAVWEVHQGQFFFCIRSYFEIIHIVFQFSIINFQFKEVLAKVLAIGRQLMMHQRGQNLLQLEEEAFARGVVVRIHVEGQR